MPETVISRSIFNRNNLDSLDSFLKIETKGIRLSSSWISGRVSPRMSFNLSPQCLNLWLRFSAAAHMCFHARRQFLLLQQTAFPKTRPSNGSCTLPSCQQNCHQAPRHSFSNIFQRWEEQSKLAQPNQTSLRDWEEDVRGPGLPVLELAAFDRISSQKLRKQA